MKLVTRAVPGGLEFRVHLKPRGSRSEVIGLIDGVLQCRVTAPPVDGRANEALIELLSEWLGAPKKALELVAGASSREKRVRVDGKFAPALQKKASEL
ncbi:MAG: DUF167 domain-containing protein [Candidatus Brocadiia bacterium]